MDYKNYTNEPIKETTPKSFKLEQPEFERVGMAKEMENLFILLKSKGLFKDYNLYDDWQERENKSKVGAKLN